MLVVASDIHLTDREDGSPVSNDELLDWLERTKVSLSTHRESVGQLHLVLNGDVIDIIRSKEWDDKKFAPWQAVSPKFKDFETTKSNKCVIDAVTNTCSRYAPFFDALRDLQQNGATVTYIAGNHDYMLQLSADARGALYRSLYGDKAPAKTVRLPSELHLPDYSAYIEHGHRCDTFNAHDENAAQWAFGDAIVMAFLNILPRRVLEKHQNLTPQSPLIQELGELDNVEPSFMVPLFISQIVEGHLARNRDGELLKQVVRDAARELLSIPEFRSAKFSTYRAFLEYLVDWNTAELLSKTVAVFDSPDKKDVVHKRAEELVATDAPTVRHVILGHNHRPAVVALDPVGDREPVYYLNTGTWRRVFRRVVGASPVRFASMRTLCWVELWNPPAESVTRFRHVHERVG